MGQLRPTGPGSGRRCSRPRPGPRRSARRSPPAPWRRRPGRRRRSRPGCRGRGRAGRRSGPAWTSLVSASTRNAWRSWPSRLNRVLASEQSPQNTPARCRSTSRPAIASSSRSRCLTSSRGSRRNSRRNCQECSRYSVTRIELPVSAWSTSPTGRTAGSSADLQVPQHPVLLVGDPGRQLLEGVQDVVGLHEADQVAARPDVEVAEAGRVLGPLSSGSSHGRASSPGEAARRRIEIGAAMAAMVATGRRRLRIPVTTRFTFRYRTPPRARRPSGATATPASAAPCGRPRPAARR